MSSTAGAAQQAGGAPQASGARAAGRLRLAFYGDDFTGSTDALEVLAFAGLNCALFLTAPTPEVLERFGQLDAIGLAGASRAMTPAEMDAALPAPLQALAELAPIVHYKVCSTFDSGAAIGSIGRVIELARRHVAPGPVPIVAGNPALGRYCLFGHLFARAGTDGLVHRIDRHPIMRAHPVTPMEESDLAVHIGRQARDAGVPLQIAKLTLADFAQGSVALGVHFAQLAGNEAHDAVLIDSATPEHLTEVGRLIDALSHRRRPLFVVGSSGLQYALTQWWRDAARPTGEAPNPMHRYAHCAAAGPVLVVSASASALTAMQIDTALAAGFAEVPVNAHELVGPPANPAQAATANGRIAERLVHEAAGHLAAGRSVIVHTARGNTDPRINALLDSLAGQGLTRAEAAHQGGRALGQRLGEITRALLGHPLLARAPLKRIVLSGGDTSSMVTQALAPLALTVLARLAPGAPLCKLHAPGTPLDGLEVALKGGQMGDAHYFVKARDGVA